MFRYLDVDFSGGHKVCNQSFADNLGPLTAWLKTYQLKAMITEFGGDNNTMCDKYIRGAIHYMANHDECKSPCLPSHLFRQTANKFGRLDIGWTAWAAGTCADFPKDAFSEF